VDFDFAAILVTLSAVTGIIWAVDALFFAKSRAQRAAETPTLVNAVKEPWSMRSRNRSLSSTRAPSSR